MPRLFCVAAIVLLLLSCSAESSGSSPPTWQQLRDAAIEGVLQETVTLVDGAYVGPPHMPGAASRDAITLIPDIYATGDLTGDGIEEAIVAVALNSGGSGLFFYLVVFSSADGIPTNVATIRLNDRVRIDSLEVDGGRLIADLVEHGNDDPMCCPTKIVHREWEIRDGNAAEVLVEETPMKGRFVGHLVWGHEARSFVDCDGQREAWVINEAGDELVEVYESLTLELYQPMFVEVRGEIVDPPSDGFGSEYSEALRVSELIRAENEGFGCRRDLQGFAFFASGNEPGWRLEVRMDGLSLSRMGSPDDVELPPAAISSEDDAITFNSNNSDSHLRAVFERKRCVDSMSGARYSFAATVDVDGQQYQGCALQGH